MGSQDGDRWGAVVDGLEARLDRAIAQRDRQRFGEACNALFTWAVDFAEQHGLRSDSSGAEQVAHAAWVRVVARSFAVLDALPRAGGAPIAAAPQGVTGNEIVGRLVQRLLGFRCNGRRIPGEITKYLADRRRGYHLLAARACRTAHGDDRVLDQILALADPNPTPAELAQRDEEEQILMGPQLEENLLGIADTDVREMLRAVAAYLRDYRARYGPGPIPLFRQRQTPVVPEPLLAELRQAMGLKSPKAIVNRLIEIWPLLTRVALLSGPCRPEELLRRTEALRVMAQRELAPGTRRAARAAVTAICRWAESRAETAIAADVQQVTLPSLLTYHRSRRFLDPDLALFLLDTLGGSHDVVRRRVFRAIRQLEARGLVKFHV